MDSMKELEKQADRLLGELTELRRQNRVLTGRVSRLEKAAKSLESAASPSLQRAELARRVRRLVDRLEKLDSA